MFSDKPSSNSSFKEDETAMAPKCHICERQYRDPDIIPVQYSCCKNIICRRCAIYIWVNVSKFCTFENCQKEKTTLQLNSIGQFRKGAPVTRLKNSEEGIVAIPLKDIGLVSNDNWKASNDVEDLIDQVDPYLPEEDDGLGQAHYELRERGRNLDLKCHSCNHLAKDVYSYKAHLLSHYHVLFSNLPELPSEEPFRCPICERNQRNKQSLFMHYAWRHDRFFEVTELDPNDYPTVWRVKRRPDYITPYRTRQRGPSGDIQISDENGNRSNLIEVPKSSSIHETNARQDAYFVKHPIPEPATQNAALDPLDDDKDVDIEDLIIDDDEEEEHSKDCESDSDSPKDHQKLLEDICSRFSDKKRVGEKESNSNPINGNERQRENQLLSDEREEMVGCSPNELDAGEDEVVEDFIENDDFSSDDKSDKEIGNEVDNQLDIDEHSMQQENFTLLEQNDQQNNIPIPPLSDVEVNSCSVPCDSQDSSSQQDEHKGHKKRKHTWYNGRKSKKLKHDKQKQCSAPRTSLNGRNTECAESPCRDEVQCDQWAAELRHTGVRWQMEVTPPSNIGGKQSFIIEKRQLRNLGLDTGACRVFQSSR